MSDYDEAVEAAAEALANEPLGLWAEWTADNWHQAANAVLDASGLPQRVKELEAELKDLTLDRDVERQVSDDLQADNERLERERDRLRRVLEDERDEHRPVEMQEQSGLPRRDIRCGDCGFAWPCPTRRRLDAAFGEER